MKPNAEAVRFPAVAGAFYPGQPAALRRAIEEAFLSPLGPGELPPVQAGPRRIAGIIVPHAGYVYSGSGAAWAYAEVARDGRPGAAVILGVNHHGAGAPLALSPASGWETPLGMMPVAQELGQRLQALDPELVFDARAHAQEHSLEVHVPFLQYLFGELPILPLVMQAVPVSSLQRLGHALAALAAEQDILLIASTDFSHFISHAEAERLDRLALDRIAAVDPDGLLKVVAKYGITMCGVFPVAAVLTATADMGIHTARVLHYHTSGDVIANRQEVVGYGTAILYR